MITEPWAAAMSPPSFQHVLLIIAIMQCWTPACASSLCPLPTAEQELSTLRWTPIYMVSLLCHGLARHTDILSSRLLTTTATWRAMSPHQQGLAVHPRALPFRSSTRTTRRTTSPHRQALAGFPHALPSRPPTTTMTAASLG